MNKLYKQISDLTVGQAENHDLLPKPAKSNIRIQDEEEELQDRATRAEEENQELREQLFDLKEEKEAFRQEIIRLKAEHLKTTGRERDRDRKRETEMGSKKRRREHK